MAQRTFPIRVRPAEDETLEEGQASVPAGESSSSSLSSPAAILAAVFLIRAFDIRLDVDPPEAASADLDATEFPVVEQRSDLMLRDVQFSST